MLRKERVREALMKITILFIGNVANCSNCSLKVQICPSLKEDIPASYKQSMKLRRLLLVEIPFFHQAVVFVVSDKIVSGVEDIIPFH